MKAKQHTKSKFGFKSPKAKAFVWTILAINIAHFLVFWLYANIDGILMSFKNATGGVEYWTMENFRWTFESIVSGELRLAFRNTMIFFVYNIIIFPIGLFYAYAFFKKMPGRNFYRLMFFLPGIISGVVMSTFFTYLFQPTGPIGLLWTTVTGSVAPAFFTDSRYALTLVILYGFWTSYAGSLLILSGAFARISPDIIDSGKMDGVGWLREMWQICIPLIWPTLSVIIVTNIANIFNFTGEIFLLTAGRGDTTTINYWMFAQVRLQNSYYRPSAFGLILTCIAIPLMLVVRYFVNKAYADVEY